MYSGKIRCIRALNSMVFIKGEIYELNNGVFTKGKTVDNSPLVYHTIFKSLEHINAEFTSQFEEVKSNKVTLLLKNGYEVKTEEYRYKLYLKNHLNGCSELQVFYKFGKDNEILSYIISWDGKHYKKLKDVQPILDALNIEIIEEHPKFKIDSEKEYTKEEMEKLKELGLNFKEVGNV
jgi:hypothetical protein